MLLREPVPVTEADYPDAETRAANPLAGLDWTRRHGVVTNWPHLAAKDQDVPPDCAQLTAGAHERAAGASSGPESEAGEYPLDALSPLLRSAATAIRERAQCAGVTAAHAVLAHAMQAVQGRNAVRCPLTGRRVPLSLYLLTLAHSGESKSTADDLAAVSAHDYERAAWAEYRARIQSERDDKAPEPKAPLILVDDTSLDGLLKAFGNRARPQMQMLSTAEGATFFAGYVMNKDNRPRGGGTLARLWDGKGARFTRVKGETFIPSARIGLNIAMQPALASMLYGDRQLEEQGFVPRFLAGEAERVEFVPRRFDGAELPGLVAYRERVRHLLDTQPHDSESGEPMEPTLLRLDGDAATLHHATFADISRRAFHEDLRDVVAYAKRSAEHALRLAAIMAVAESPDAETVGAEHVVGAWELLAYYIRQYQRLRGAKAPTIERGAADELLAFLERRSPDGQPVKRGAIVAGVRTFRDDPRLLDRAAEVLVAEELIEVVAGPRGGKLYALAADDEGA